METGPEPGDILDLSRPQLAEWLTEHGIAPYRAGQILRWIYLRQKDRFDDMTDLSKDDPRRSAAALHAETPGAQGG